MSATKIVCVRCEGVCVSVMMGVCVSVTMGVCVSVSVMMGGYQYFHVCFRVESGRNESLVLCELIQHCLTQDGLYNGGKEVVEGGEGRRWEVGEGGKVVGMEEVGMEEVGDGGGGGWRRWGERRWGWRRWGREGGGRWKRWGREEVGEGRGGCSYHQLLTEHLTRESDTDEEIQPYLCV